MRQQNTKATFGIPTRSLAISPLFLTLLLLFSPAWSGTAADQCDKYGARKSRGASSTTGIEFEDLDTKKMTDVCEAAVLNEPKNGRLLFHLGRSYQRAGRHAEAFQHFGQAAAENYAPAYNAIGGAYENGLSVEKNMRSAFEWYRNAAGVGDAVGQYNLALIYEFGRGQPRSISNALKFYELSANQGYAEAQDAIGYLYSQGADVERNDSLAAVWFRKAADQGLATAENNLAVLYESGRGVARDRERAFYWYNRAANHGLEKARVTLEALRATRATSSSPTTLDKITAAQRADTTNHTTLRARGAGFVPGALVCPNHQVLMAAFSAYTKSVTQQFQSKISGERFRLLQGHPLPLPNLEAMDCILLSAGTPVTLVSNKIVPLITAQLPDGRTISGVTLVAMIISGNSKGFIRP